MTFDEEARTTFDAEDLKVCQEALTLLRQDQPLTLDELNDADTANAVARKCRAVYESARLEVLIGHDWNFARREVAVRAAPGGRPGEFRFAMPAGAAKLVRVLGTDGEERLHWRVAEDSVFADGLPAAAEFTEDVADAGRWHPLVRRAFVHCLARDLAIPVTGRQSDLKNMDALYQDKLKLAVLADAREEQPNPWEEAHYPKAMRGGSPRRNFRFQISNLRR